MVERVSFEKSLQIIFPDPIEYFIVDANALKIFKGTTPVFFESIKKITDSLIRYPSGPHHVFPAHSLR